MRITYTLLLVFLSSSAYSQAGSGLLPRGEFYPITDAYLFESDSIFTMKEEYVDVSSKILILFTGSNSRDSSVIISIDHGNDKVMYLGFAEEIEAPANFDFLTGKKTYYDWKYHEHDIKEPGECLVIREYITELKNMVPLEYFRFHFFFEEYKYMFYCDIPVINFLSSDK